jgi:hypothetical protein
VIVARMVSPKDAMHYLVNSSPASVYDTLCKLETTWDFRGRIDYLDPDATRGAVAMIPDRSDVRIVNAFTGALLGRFTMPLGSTVLHFGANGAALCVGRSLQGAFECYDTRSGQLIAPHPEVMGGVPFDVSRNSTIVLLTDGAERTNPFTETGRAVYHAWVLWDFQTRRELGRLKCRMQKPFPGPKGYQNLFASAIAPDGKSFAIAGDGVVEMYDIPRHQAR